MNSASMTLSAPFKVGVRSFYADTGRHGRYSGNGEDYVSVFHKLVRRWRQETSYVSSTDQIFSHPSFLEIVGMGEKVIPLIIQELETQPDLLIGALAIISGDDPVSDGDRGNVYAMALAWIEWGKRRYK